MKFKKIFLILMIAGFFLAIGFSQVVNDSQLIKGNHWIYNFMIII